MLKSIAPGLLICLALLDTRPSIARGSDLDSPAKDPDAGDRSMPTQMKDLLGPDGIDWNSFLAIQAAADEASRKGVKVEKCRIRAVEEDTEVIVWFTNVPKNPYVRGCPPGPCRCFAVEFAKDGLRVLKAHFTK
jgi:hypothetical protein